MQPIFWLYLLIGVISIISIIGFGNPDLVQKYFYNQNRVQNQKQYYRMLTSSFLHADYMHLFFNMYVLFMFGASLTGISGLGAGFLYGVYFASVLGGSVLSYFLHLNQWMYSALGASGGVTGVLMAYVVLFPDRELGIIFIPGFSLPGYIFIFLYLCYEVYMMINPRDNIGHDAHLGGAIVGTIISLFFMDDFSTDTMLKIGLVSVPLIYGLVYSVKKIKGN